VYDLNIYMQCGLRIQRLTMLFGLLVVITSNYDTSKYFKEQVQIKNIVMVVVVSCDNKRNTSTTGLS